MRYCDCGPASAGLTETPRATLGEGAAGVAYFLLRHAQLGGGAVSLAAAESWAAEAVGALAKGDGLANPWTPIDELVHSLHYGAPGVWWVRALVAAAAENDTEVRRAVGRFTEAAASAFGTPGDVNSGSAGLLLGCAQLVESVHDEGTVDAIRAAGSRLFDDLLAFAERDAAQLEYLGAAHGLGGVAHTLLRWSVVAGQPSPRAALDLLDRLLELRRPSGRWPIRAGSREVWLGWCHGSAGWAMTWALAAQLTGEERYLELARWCAEDAVAADDENVSVCCGRPGQAFAALTLYRATGEQSWLDGARRVARQAAAMTPDDDIPAHRLFTGRLGVALLAVELEEPARAAMPVYEAIA